jgi:hypothetical protein
LRNSVLGTPAAAALERASSSISSVISTPMALPVGPTRRAEISTSAPAPQPRSSTVSPARNSATAVGTPHPRDATLGLLLVIFALAHTRRASSAPAAVGAYIGAAYFFTSSSCEPRDHRRAHVLRHLRGHRPGIGPGLRARAAGGRHRAAIVLRTLYPSILAADAATVVLPHSDGGAVATGAGAIT